MPLQIRAEPDERGAEVGRRVIAERFDLRKPIECRLNDTALDAGSASVNDADFAEAGPRRGVDVLLDDGRDVARREHVEIDLALDGQPMSRRIVFRVTRPVLRLFVL